MQDVTIKIYPGMRHEVLNEIGKQEVWDDVLSWIDNKLG
jgi:alpha-beta hydrolase superfamily lysophospholipase